MCWCGEGKLPCSKSALQTVDLFFQPVKANAGADFMLHGNTSATSGKRWSIVMLICNVFGDSYFCPGFPKINNCIDYCSVL